MEIEVNMKLWKSQTLILQECRNNLLIWWIRPHSVRRYDTAHTQLETLVKSTFTSTTRGVSSRINNLSQMVEL
jgi:hypothetical protein